MKAMQAPLLISQDAQLLHHWRTALQGESPTVVGSVAALRAVSLRGASPVAWLDLSLPGLPPWSHPDWHHVFREQALPVVAASAHPRYTEAIAALQGGCAGYCHAYSPPHTLVQVQQVTSLGQVWLDRHLVHALIAAAQQPRPSHPARTTTWDTRLTLRERQVARMAAQGITNQQIAGQCGITERTVKAHLSAVFEKLGIPDRMQLALKIHGIPTPV